MRTRRETTDGATVFLVLIYDAWTRPYMTSHIYCFTHERGIIRNLL